MTGYDAINFVKVVDCQDAVDKIASKIVIYSGPPSEDEILSRCRHVFECILHTALTLSCPECDLTRFEVEIQIENS